MTKTEFLDGLRAGLSDLDPADIQKSTDYYDEMICDRTEDGMSEEEAVAAIGPVEDAVSEVLLATPLPKLVKAKVKPKRSLRGIEILLLVLGAPLYLPFLVLLVSLVLTVYVLLFSMVAVLAALLVSTLITGIGGLVLTVISLFGGAFSTALALFGIGLFSIGLSVFLSFGIGGACRGLLSLARMFLRFLKSLFIGKKVSA